MSAQLSIQLARSSFYLDPGQNANGDLKIQIRNDHDQDIDCKLIKIKIPYGDHSEALTNSNSFSLANMEYWSEPQSPFEIQNGFVCITIYNDYDTIEKGFPEEFHLYQIPFLANPEGSSSRTVNVTVECYANPDWDATQAVELPFTLENQPEADPQPFVNYFVVDKLNVQSDEIITVSWEIAHGKDMVLYPVFLSDRDQQVSRKKAVAFLDDTLPQPILVNTDTPIRITKSSGRLQLKPIQSTQFTLVADNQNRKGISQIIVYLKELTVIDFSVRGEQDLKKFPYLSPITLDWIITFSDKKARDNQAWLAILEFDNNNKPLATDSNILYIPPRINATRIVSVNPRETYGSFTYYPVRKTNFILYISEDRDKISKTSNLSLMTTSGSTPIGSVTIFPGRLIPKGWRACNGSKISRNSIPETFDELARVLEQTSNSGTLTLPNLRDRFPVGAGRDSKLRISGGPDPVRHRHIIDPPPKTFKSRVAGKHRHSIKVNHGRQVADNDDNDGAFWAAKLPLSGSAGMSGEHAHWVDVNIPGFQSQADQYHPRAATNSARAKKAALNRPKYYPVTFIIRVS